LCLAVGPAYAQELNKRCRPHLRPTNKSYRIDETYIRINGQDRYLYRAVDSTGQTIEFLLTAKRDAAAAKRFLVKAIEASGSAMPRVLNVDKNPAYPAAVEALKAEGALPRRVRLRQCKYLNNVIEQDHRIVKRRVWLAKGYGSFQSAWRTLQGIETVHIDSERKSEMAGQRRCARSSTLHYRPVRHPGVADFTLQSILHGRSAALFELRNRTPLMDMDFAVSRPLVRHWRLISGIIRYLSIDSHV